MLRVLHGLHDRGGLQNELHLVEFLMQLSRADVLAREKLHEQVFAFAQLRGEIRFVLTPRFFPKLVPFEFIVVAAMTLGMSECRLRFFDAQPNRHQSYSSSCCAEVEARAPLSHFSTAYMQRVCIAFCRRLCILRLCVTQSICRTRMCSSVWEIDFNGPLRRVLDIILDHSRGAGVLIITDQVQVSLFF